MKLASWSHRGRDTWGAVVGPDDSALVDLGARMPGVASIDALLAADALGTASALAARTAPDLALADARLRKPLSGPGKLV